MPRAKHRKDQKKKSRARTERIQDAELIQPTTEL